MPPLKDPCLNIDITSDVGKLEWWATREWKKVWEYV